jgi:hypothetical protein
MKFTTAIMDLESEFLNAVFESEWILTKWGNILHK